MSIFDYFRKSITPRNSATMAKERLQIMIAHERGKHADFLPLLQEELIRVISKYVKVDQKLVKVQLKHKGDISVLDLNITLPDQDDEVRNEKAQQAVLD